MTPKSASQYFLTEDYMPLAIEAKQLTLTLGKDPLFSDLDLNINKGEFVAVIGPNGSGKTSLIKLILGLHKQTSGSLQVYEPNIGYVPQYLQKDEFSPLTVRELFSLKIASCRFWANRKADDEAVRTALAKTQVEHVIDQAIRHLSGGEFQRVMIAYALIGNPGLLILDEPVSGIDIAGEQEFFDMLERIHKQEQMTILLISHDLNVVYRYATQVICLNRKLICQGVPSDVLTQETIEKTFSTKHGLYQHHHNDHV